MRRRKKFYVAQNRRNPYVIFTSILYNIRRILVHESISWTVLNMCDSRAHVTVKYFCLCNGTRLPCVYTSHGSGTGPIGSPSCACLGLQQWDLRVSPLCGSSKLDTCHTKTSSAVVYILMSLVLVVPLCHTIAADVIVGENRPYNTKREGCVLFGQKYRLRQANA
ncbi:Piso0_004429 [Millerozyma farinosa CBS 7064]|uniref:Piso0_004429 protein n=1 Tax=Pichia sorbitophila (strain ATCC MYA-4447 / BCRC 22081 / CBS 7064 / NBRC 10061 / NRRL Y-12695) TaxID=559304 RepID=G8Y5F9_PICSO|nr:Piso0_004429 [Millerozyma farinosa CBS 7064]CCE84870.1 Piso0_004429 [Millerozyma farinosa CBS 7064]